MNKNLQALAVAGLCGVAACTNVPIVNDAGPNMTNYMNGEFEYASKSGEIRTQVVGNPFGIPQDQVDRAVTAAMYGANRGNPVVFTTHPTREPDNPYKVVMAFGLPFGMVNDSVCVEPAGGYPARPQGATLVTAAFCRGETLMTHASATISGPVALDSPAFVSLVRNSTYAMIPRDDRKDIGSDGGGIP
jgi:hypothetical protein